MKYLYGDQTPSPLQTNVLAWLGDAMEFCIHLVLAEQRLIALRSERRATDGHADEERARIAGLRALVLEAAEAANRLGGESMSELAARRVIGASQEAIAATLAELDAKLNADRAVLAARDRAERESCLDALATWIALHETHEGTWSLTASVDENDCYVAETQGSTPFGLAWKCAIELDEQHPMRRGIRVGDLVSRMELSIPEVSGWFKKGPKLKQQRIDPFSIDAFWTDGIRSTFTLRTAPRSAAGLDVQIRDEEVTVLLAGARESVELEVEVSPFDTQRLIALRDRVREALTMLPGVRRRIVLATLDDALLADHQDFVAVATRVIAFAAPIVQEIRNHSLSPGELVIRRPLQNEDMRRSWEEIFVSTSALLQKVGRLPRELRGLFAPLGLDPQRARTPLPFEAVRITPVAEVRPVDPPKASEQSVVVEPSVIVDPEAAQSLGSIIIDPQLVAIDPRVVAEHINGGVVASPRSRSATQIEIDATNKEALATTVKRIVRSAKEGHTEEAYAAYAELFGDSRFAQQRLQDQRQVLKLMVLAKTEPHPSEQVTSAYESALARLRALAAEADDPLDREMIAVCEKRLNRNGASPEPTTSS